VGVGEKRDLELGQKLLGELGVASAYRLQLDLGQSVDAYGACSGVGEVDDAVVRYRAAIVYADEDRFVVPEIGDPDPTAEGQAAMSAGEGVHIEGLAIGCGVTLEAGAIPGGFADLVPVVRLCLIPGMGSRIFCRRSRIAGC